MLESKINSWVKEILGGHRLGDKKLDIPLPFMNNGPSLRDTEHLGYNRPGFFKTKKVLSQIFPTFLLSIITDY